MQPTYLPWLGYFELMARSDHFVAFDDVQFVKKSWHHRNRIKSLNGELMLVVPIKTSGKRFQHINEAMIDNTQDWGRKHLRSIESNYLRAPYFRTCFEPLREIYQIEHTSLLALNLAIIEYLKAQFGINTPVSLSSSIPTRAERDEKIIDICRHFGTDVLYDSRGAQALLNPERFADAGIALKFQNYRHPEYRQLYGSFLPNLSALDLLFNEGPQALSIVLSGTADEAV